MIKTIYFYLSVTLLFSTICIKNSYAALPVDECESFIEEELILMCLEFSIAERITDELPHSFYSIDHNHDRDYLSSSFFRGKAISPIEPVKDLPYRWVDSSRFYIHRAFYDIDLSNDDPDTTFFEINFLFEYGKAYVYLEKRTMD